MTTPNHICFTCADFICSCACWSIIRKEAYLIGNCLHYCGKNAGERKSCKLYNKADQLTISNRKQFLSNMEEDRE